MHSFGTVALIKEVINGRFDKQWPQVSLELGHMSLLDVDGSVTLLLL